MTSDAHRRDECETPRLAQSAQRSVLKLGQRTGGSVFSSRRRHTEFDCDWSSDVWSSDLDDQGRDLHVVEAVEDVVAGQCPQRRDQARRLQSVPGDLLQELRPQGSWLVEEAAEDAMPQARSEEHTSELQSQSNIVCRLLLE